MKNNRKLKRESKTMRNPKVIEIHFVKDESSYSDFRVEEAKNLIAQMILLNEETVKRKKNPSKSKSKK